MISKAVQGAAMLAGAVGMGALAFFNPALIASPFFLKAMASLALGGIAMEAGAIADTLTSNRGMTISTRQPAAPRQIIYGEQRVGGVIVYQSTTGSHHDQYNFVIAVAGHEIWAIKDLYLDGRKVWWDEGSGGHSARNGVHFGGTARNTDATGPNGQQYNFGGKVYCEARFGDQAVGDVISGLTANDPAWAAGPEGSPYLGGCAYVYLKVVYDQNLFPGLPEVNFTVMGKEVYDPRSGQTTYSHNWALIAADIITNDIGDPVNEDQLIAAANVCDEWVALAGGGQERRYSCHMHYDTATDGSDALANMMEGAAGRLSWIGGEYYIWPAYWQGPSFSFDQRVLTGEVEWSPNRSFAELVNRVAGTYTAANYPYNVEGNLYDSSGYYDGSMENTFPFAFQPTNFPQYAKDVHHGYVNDQYLLEDGGIPLPKELSLTTVLSVTQAQRVAKINLMRNRKQGSGRLPMGLAAYRMQPCDVMHFSFPFLGWADKVLEITQVSFEVQGGDSGGEEGKAAALMASFAVQETGPDVYAWDPDTEELTVYDVPASTMGVPYIVGAPQNLVVLSSAATAVTQPDGTTLPRIEVTWDSPLDAYVTQIQMRYRVSGTSTWLDAGSVDAGKNLAFITGVVAGETYDVGLRSVRSNGGASAWVEQFGAPAGYVLSTTNEQGIGPGSLIGEAYTNGSAGIFCQPFTALLGNRSVSYFPGGAVALTGLVQQTRYWVYVVDLTGSGGDLTPVATQDRADFVGKAGHFLIDSIVTGYAASGGGAGQRYKPSSYQDNGTRSTLSPDAAYDGDGDSAAMVSGSTSRDTTAYGDCLFQGDPAVASASASTLKVVASALVGGYAGASAQIIASIGGVETVMATLTDSTAKTTYECAVPADVPFSTIAVRVLAQPAVVVDESEPTPLPTPGEPDPPTPPTRYYSSFVSVEIADIYVQT